MSCSKPRVIRTRVSRALVKSGLPDLDYALNPYLGCWHACTYCYGRLYVRDPMVSANWGQVILVRENIVEAVRREVKGLAKGVVGVGTITDAYQPVEALYKLTRECILVLLENGFEVSIQTKNPLILRDLDLLVEHRKLVDVGFTITTLNKEKALFIEPCAPSPKSRVKALEKIASYDINTWVFMGPIIPGINDRVDDIEELVLLAKDTGSIFYYDKLRVKEFMLNPKHPLHPYALRAKVYDWNRLYRMINEVCRRHGVKCLFGMDYSSTRERSQTSLDRFI